jgi:hypothetical protein
MGIADFYLEFSSISRRSLRIKLTDHWPLDHAHGGVPVHVHAHDHGSDHGHDNGHGHDHAL